MIDQETKNVKTHAKLGFTHLETAEIVKKMNLLLADYHVHYQKLRKFHWNCEGPDFFDLHEQFENQYNEIKLEIDEVAERVRVFGQKPWGTMYEYLQNAQISEVEKEMLPYEMVREILNDYEVILMRLMDVNDAAGEIGDSGTVDMISSYIRKLEKRNWMMTAFSKNPEESAS